MPRITSLEISESLKELQTAMRQENAPYLLERIQALILIKQGKVNNLKDIESFIGKDYSTIARWIRVYHKQGLTGILKYRRGVRQPSNSRLK